MILYALYGSKMFNSSILKSSARLQFLKECLLLRQIFKSPTQWTKLLPKNQKS